MHKICLEEKVWELAIAWRELKSRRIRTTSWVKSKITYYFIMWLRKTFHWWHGWKNNPIYGSRATHEIVTSFLFVCFQDRFECIWARKLNCSALCHRAVGEYLYNLHDNKFIFERSYLLTDVHFWGSLRCECRKLVPMVCRPGWVCHITLQQIFHVISSLNGRLQ